MSRKYVTFKYALIFTVDKRKRNSAVSGVPFEMKVLLIFILQINTKGEHIIQECAYIVKYLMRFVGRNMKRGTNKGNKLKRKRMEDER
jgi:hypothetical protein